MSPRARATLSAFAVLASFVVSSAVAAPHPSIPPPVIPDCLGVNIHFTDPKPGEMEMLAAAGFKWVRMDFTWEATERVKGEYDFAAYDRLVAHLDKHKLRALFILNYGNPLYDDGLPPHTDEARAAFAAWAAAAVKHFAGKGYLWEMWNEPNIAQFWKPKPDVQQYIALAKTTAAALKKVAPREAFIGPATSTIDLPFLEACFQAGLLESWAGVSVHPYRQTAPETVEEELRSVRLLIREYAPKDKAPGDIPVISGEWGYSDRWPCGTPGTEAIAEQFLTNITNDVALSIWYEWRDDGLDPKNPEHHFGVVQHESVKDEKLPFKPKRAYVEAKTLTEELRGYRFSKRLVPENNYSADEPSARVLLFSRSKTEQKLVVYWTGDSSKDTQIRLPASHGLFKMRAVTQDSYSSFFPREAAGDAGIFMDAISWGVKYLTPEKPNDFLMLAAASPRMPLDYVFHWPEVLHWSDRATNGLVSGFKNPLKQKVTLLRGFSSPEIPVKPGGICEERQEVGTGSRKARTLETEHYTIKMGNGQVLTLEQGTTLVCTNPLDVAVLPPATDALVVRILNPSGEPANLKVRDYDAGIEGNVSVTIEAGQKEKIVRLPLATSFDKLRKVEIAIDQDYNGKFGSGSGTVFAHDFGMWLSLPPLDSASLQLNADGDEKAEAKFATGAAEISPPDTGGTAVKLSYQFGTGWKFIQARAPFPPIQLSGLADGWYSGWPKHFALWVHGDGKGCAMRIRFKDASDQTFQADGPKVDWTGWRFVKFPMQTGECASLAHWGGPNDGNIHYPIKWDTIFLLDNVSREPVEGEIYLSAPTLIY